MNVRRNLFFGHEQLKNIRQIDFRYHTQSHNRRDRQ